MLEAHDIACRRGERLLFRRLGFTLNEGGLLRIIGTNGSGKTSLLRILGGLTTPEAGEVRWQGTTLQDEREAFAAALLYLGHALALNDLLTPLENLRFAAALSATPASEAACVDALARIGLARQQALPCKLLSQGQRRRVGLARLFLADDHPLWILDEPFTALDTAAVAELTGVIARHAERGGMAVFTTHQDADLPSRTLDVEDFAA